jgi:hypothetical protein
MLTIALDVMLESEVLRPVALIECSPVGALAGTVSWTVAVPGGHDSPEHGGKVCVSVVADQPAGKLVNVKLNESDASPVFRTKNEMGSGVSIVTSVAAVEGSTRMPGPRTSK